MSEYQNPETAPQTEETTEQSREPLRDFIYHQRRAYEEAGKAIEALLPEGFRVHSAEARKEFFQSFKVLLDAAAEGLERVGKEVERVVEESGDSDKSSSGTSKVRVEVE